MDGVALGENVEFGPWRYDRRLGRLFRKNSSGEWEPTAIGSRANDILAVLLREPGALVSKNALMDAVWPGVTVEPNNLTVQIAAVRRVIDEGLGGQSYIQTVPGRGYRLIYKDDEFCRAAVGAEMSEADAVPRGDEDLAAPLMLAQSGTESGLRDEDLTIPQVHARLRVRQWWLIGAVFAGLATFLIAAYGPSLIATPTPPRMSILILPFEHLGDSPADGMANALTNDLTTALGVKGDITVVSGQKSAAILKLAEAGPAVAGQKVSARFVFKGSEQRLADVLQVNAQVIATESGKVVWTDRFDVPMADTVYSQRSAVERLWNGIEARMIALEAARSQSERPDSPDAFDLYLRARLLSFQPFNPEAASKTRSLLERAVLLDPPSNEYKLWLIGAILTDEDENAHGRKAAFEETRQLLTDVSRKEPLSWAVAINKIYWLYWQENRHCSDVVDDAEHYLATYATIAPMQQIGRWLATCKIVLGHADEAAVIMERSVALGDESSRSRDYRTLQFALLLLGRYDESIRLGERALAANPNDVGYERARMNRRLAAAYALTGRVEIGQRKLAEADRIQPYVTLRELDAIENASPIYVAQLASYKDGLKRAGMRDHAEEDANFGSLPDGRLHQEYRGPTPLLAPGATTIRTDELVRLLADRKPVIIDALTNSIGQSIPGAVGLRYVGAGGELSDSTQDRLKVKMRDITGDDLDTPVVAVGWNSESFDGRNLALRLVSAGYKHVYWYRGGRESWEVRGLPETILTEQDW